MQEQLPLVILAGPSLVLVAAVVLRVASRRWPGVDTNAGEEVDR